MKSSAVKDPSSWEIVALSSAVAGEPKAIRCNGADYVLFRDESRHLRALVDQCAHRRAPLSLGKIVGGVIECPYHGWRYDGSGACVSIPNLAEGKRVPRNYRVAAIEVVEDDGFIYLLAPQEPPSSGPSSPKLPGNWQPFDASREIESLVAYPGDQLMDVISEMPSAFLKVGSVRILDDLPFGDPVQTRDSIDLEFAADPFSRRKLAKVRADFPLRLTLSAARHLNIVDIAVAGDDGMSLARAHLAITPATAGLCVVHLRCLDGTYGGRPLGIDIRPHPDAMLVRSIKPFASILRRDAAPIHSATAQ